MRIHSDKIETADVRNALPKGVMIAALSRHKSRTRDHGIEIRLYGTSSYRTQDGSGQAATWDEWGILLAVLFELDPKMVAAGYPSADEYHWITGDRFRTLRVEDQHRRHSWEYTGKAATGSYVVHTCTCGAITRRMSYGHSFSEISD